MLKLNIIENINIKNSELKLYMKKLFDNNLDIYKECEEKCINLINIWKTSNYNYLIKNISNLWKGKFKSLSDPILFPNTSYLSINNNSYYIQGFTNELTIWIPFFNTTHNQETFGLIPKSHNEVKKMESFGVHEFKNESKYNNKFSFYSLNEGDLILYKSSLVHKLQYNCPNNLNWSCNMLLRY